MSPDEDNSLPKPTPWDYAYTAAKAALSAVPVLGGPAAELFAAILAPPITRRRDEWLHALAEALSSLEDRVDGFNPGSLAQNDAFVSAALQSTRVALQTHQTEKLDALRNALLNIAVGRAPDEDQQAMFLSYIETLTAWHIRMLKFFEAPMQLAASRGARTDYAFGGALAQPLEESYPELRGRRDFYDQITRDLKARGFLNSSDDVLHVMMTGSGLAAKRTTELADQFLAFIQEPRELHV